jgi:hypothetical protein
MAVGADTDLAVQIDARGEKPSDLERFGGSGAGSGRSRANRSPIVWTIASRRPERMRCSDR